VSAKDVTVTVTATPTTTAPVTDQAAPSRTGDAGPQTTTEESPVLDWTADDARGLPAEIGGAILVPVDAGLQVRDAENGAAARTIDVQRGDYTGRVDATAVGAMVIEVRGSQVVGLAG
jgi:hypothetical protein